MKHSSISFLAFTIMALVAMPLLGRADSRPDFEDDAKPILSQQPGLIEYVESRFQVKDTGIAKMPGDDDHAPVPPYIFRARPRGSNGPYNLRLLIQPGPPGHILGIVKEGPSVNPQIAPTPNPAIASKAPVVNNLAQTNNPSASPLSPDDTPAITSDTPSGPIGDSSKNPAPAFNQAPGLAPPTRSGPSHSLI